MNTRGFTLAELLISLAILGVIATFTIPKVLNSSQNSEWNAAAKETMSTISGAYQAYQLNNTPSASTSSADLTSFMNFVAVDSTSTVDSYPGDGTQNCFGTEACLKFHQGGMLVYSPSSSFGGTSATDGILYIFEPDGINTGNEDSLVIALYFNGRITTGHNILPGTDPTWFSW